MAARSPVRLRIFPLQPEGNALVIHYGLKLNLVNRIPTRIEGNRVYVLDRNIFPQRVSRIHIDFLVNAVCGQVRFILRRFEFLFLYFRLNIRYQIPPLLIRQVIVRFHRGAINPRGQNHKQIFFIESKFIRIGVCQVINKNPVIPDIIKFMRNEPIAQ